MDELRSIFGKSNRPVTNEDLKNATYLDWIMKEVMRLFTISYMIGRETTSEIQLGNNLSFEQIVLHFFLSHTKTFFEFPENMTIPSGVSVVVSLFELHRDPKYWKDPLKFIPERFEPEEVAKRHPYAYLPFSVGQRNCIGTYISL